MKRSSCQGAPLKPVCWDAQKGGERRGVAGHCPSAMPGVGYCSSWVLSGSGGESALHWCCSPAALASVHTPSAAQ